MKGFLDQPQAKVIFGTITLVAVVLAWAVALRAIDTGSLWQYAATFVLAGFAIRSAVYLVKSFKS